MRHDKDWMPDSGWKKHETHRMTECPVCDHDTMFRVCDVQSCTHVLDGTWGHSGFPSATAGRYVMICGQCGDALRKWRNNEGEAV